MTAAARPGTRPVPRLTRGETAFILVVCVTLFLVGRGPIWQHRWDPDASILWSYAPIPLLVLLFLLRGREDGRRLTLGSFLAETLLVALLKFGITALILIAIWSFGSPPAPAPSVATSFRPSGREGRAEGEAAPRPSHIPPESTGVIRGVVMARGGTAAGALVYVRSGLERLVFAPPDETVRLDVRGGRFEPALVVLSAGQRLVVRSSDGSLHTVHAVGDHGETLLNAPVLGSGAERDLRLTTAVEHGSIRCEVHPEERADLLVVTHPFVTRSDEHGVFVLRGVPAGNVELTARSGLGTLTVRVTVVAGKTADVLLGGR